MAPIVISLSLKQKAKRKYQKIFLEIILEIFLDYSALNWFALKFAITTVTSEVEDAQLHALQQQLTSTRQSRSIPKNSAVEDFNLKVEVAPTL